MMIEGNSRNWSHWHAQKTQAAQDEQANIDRLRKQGRELSGTTVEGEHAPDTYELPGLEGVSLPAGQEK